MKNNCEEQFRSLRTYEQWNTISDFSFLQLEKYPNY